MSCIAELTIFPLDRGIHMSPFVARAIRVISDSGLPFELGPMGTCIEGDAAEVMECAGRCLTALTEMSDRVYMVVKLDWRAGTDDRMKAKVRAVEELIG